MNTNKDGFLGRFGLAGTVAGALLLPLYVAARFGLAAALFMVPIIFSWLIAAHVTGSQQPEGGDDGNPN